MKRILVIRGGAIGDFILTLPAIKLLRDSFPESHLEILGYKHIVALAENRFYADAMRSIEYSALASFFARGAELPPELADYFGSFDLVVSYLFDPDQIFERNLDLSGVDNFIAASPKITGDSHASLQLAQPLQQLDLTLSPAAAELYPAAADREFARSFLERTTSPVFAVHPGSGSEGKNWPLARWIELGALLLSSGIARSLLVVGGEADQAQLRAAKSAWRDREVAFAEDLPLPQLAAVLSECALFIGHDSGISHIAAAVGTRCVLLFGPTNPEVWAPMNPGVRVIGALRGDLSNLHVSDVLATISALAKTLPTS